MTGNVAIPAKWIVWAVVLPLAFVLGFMLATPQDVGSWAVLLLVMGVLLLPVFLKWHYPLLVFFWNASMVIPFVPGQPSIWMGMACGSLFMSFLAFIMDRSNRLQFYRPYTITLVLLTLILVVTAKVTGGLGVRALGGSSYGGRKYFTMLLGILGFFALSCRNIPRSQAPRYIAMFLLSGLTLAVGNFVYIGGESFWWVFNFFSPDYVINQATEDLQSAAGGLKFTRLSGLTWAGLAVFCWMLTRFGLRGILDFNRPWRIGLSLMLFGISLMGGYRSIVVIYVMLVLIQAYLEGLHRTRLLPAMLLAGVLGYVVLIPTAHLLPLSVQRSLTILPFVQVHPWAVVDAKTSTDWRLRMWEVLMQEEVPRHLLIGKGYTSSATDYWLSVEAFKRGFSADYEMSVIAGDYHNGPLSVLIPFGIWGFLTVTAFLVITARTLIANFRYGDPALHLINTFLLAYFIARLVFFVFIFGGISMDMWLFAGIAGMSLALNHGIAKPREEESRPQAEPLPQPVGT